MEPLAERVEPLCETSRVSAVSAERTGRTEQQQTAQGTEGMMKETASRAQRKLTAKVVAVTATQLVARLVVAVLLRWLSDALAIGH